MLLEIILALALGILAGTITGLIPGVHINLIGAILVSLSVSVLYFILPIYLIVFIVAMAITHTFVDFIPSIFLGCPDTDTELSILPGHELLKKGAGYEAIALATHGSLAAIFILAIIAFPSIIAIEKSYDIIKKAIPSLLILISILLVFSEKKKLSALLAFSLTGFLGLIVLNLELKEPLLPLLTGLFGSSMLLISINNKTKIPKQSKIQKPKIKMAKPLLGALVASPLCSFLPGLGSGQAAIIGNTIAKTDTKGFLLLLGATNTLVMGFSFIALYAVARTRTGATVAIQSIIGNLTPELILLIITITTITGCAAFCLTLFLAKKSLNIIQKVNYTKISIATLIVLTLIVLTFSHLQGFVVFVVATFTGIYCISLKIRRTHMMGCLLLPTIILYLL